MSANPEHHGLTGEERRALLRLARTAVEAAARGVVLSLAEPPMLGEALRERRACFVTLRSRGELRGCVGQLVATDPLWRAVVIQAERAATRDGRFTPVRPEEVPALNVEVSVLGSSRPLEFASPAQLLAQLRPGVDGVVLSVRGRVSTFLPQVWEELPEKERFLAQLSRKAGCDAGAWREPGVEVAVYEVEHFEEG